MADLCDLKGHIDPTISKSSEKAKYVEDLIFSDVLGKFPSSGLPCHFVPNLTIHEFETFLLSDLDKIIEVMEDDFGSIDAPKKVHDIIKGFPSIEDVNTDHNPSDRIITATKFQNKEVYQKHFHGMKILRKTGIETL